MWRQIYQYPMIILRALTIINCPNLGKHFYHMDEGKKVKRDERYFAV